MKRKKNRDEGGKETKFPCFQLVEVHAKGWLVRACEVKLKSQIKRKGAGQRGDGEGEINTRPWRTFSPDFTRLQKLGFAALEHFFWERKEGAVRRGKVGPGGGSLSVRGLRVTRKQPLGVSKTKKGLLEEEKKKKTNIFSESPNTRGTSKEGLMSVPTRSGGGKSEGGKDAPAEGLLIDRRKE